MSHHNLLIYILLFIFSICTVTTINAKPKETIVPPKRTTFLRLGIDPTRNLQTYLQGADRSGFEIVADYELKDNFLPTVETGYYSWASNNELMEYNSKGTFLRLGFDYNFLSYLSEIDRDIYFIGARYGITVFNQETPRVNISNYWGDNHLSFGSETVRAHWLEITFGAKVELFNNIFLGWTGRVKKRISTSDTEIKPYFIPGYGKTKKNTAADLNIYLLYALPLKK